MYDLIKEEGATGLLFGVPAFFGADVQTYTPKSTKNDSPFNSPKLPSLPKIPKLKVK
jgi:hypothetical protein